MKIACRLCFLAVLGLLATSAEFASARGLDLEVGGTGTYSWQNQVNGVRTRVFWLTPSVSPGWMVSSYSAYEHDLTRAITVRASVLPQLWLPEKRFQLYGDAHVWFHGTQSRREDGWLVMGPIDNDGQYGAARVPMHRLKLTGLNIGLAASWARARIVTEPENRYAMAFAPAIYLGVARAWIQRASYQVSGYGRQSNQRIGRYSRLYLDVMFVPARVHSMEVAEDEKLDPARWLGLRAGWENIIGFRHGVTLRLELCALPGTATGFASIGIGFGSLL